MDPWIDIRRAARECYQQAVAATKGDRRAAALWAAALRNDDLELRRYEPGTVVGKGVLGFLDRLAGLVNVQSGQSAEDEFVVIAHEIGHYRLHRDPVSEVVTVRSSLGGDPIDSGAGKVEGYSSRERKEVQADVFAGEFLCPSDWLRIEVHRPQPSSTGDRRRSRGSVRFGPESNDQGPAPSALERVASQLGRQRPGSRRKPECSGDLGRRASPRQCRARNRQDLHLDPPGSSSPSERRRSRVDSRADVLQQGRRGNAGAFVRKRSGGGDRDVGWNLPCLRLGTSHEVAVPGGENLQGPPS